jgi:glycerol uptake facilitator-like aquaporin
VSSTARAAVAEFIASFGVVVIAAGAVLVGRNGRLDLTGVAIAYGLASAAMSHVTAPLSGGVVNPAIAAGLWVTGRLGSARAATYVVAQLLGAVAAAVLLRFLMPRSVFDAAAGGVPALASSIPVGKGLLIEATATFLLTFSALTAGVGGSTWAAPTVTGLVVTGAVLAFFTTSGASLNPARWFGPALAAGTWTDGWVWAIGPIAGGVVAALVHSAVFSGKEPPTP